MTNNDDVEREVVEETVEETDTLDQSSLSHEERREQEREAREGGREVSLAEADWTRQVDLDRQGIREAVDDLEVDDDPPAFDPVPPTPSVTVPGDAHDADPGLTLTGERSETIAPLSRSDREAVEAAYEGEVVQALALYEARGGRIVRVIVDRGEGLEEEKAILDDGEVRDLGSITDDVDEIGAGVDLADLDEDALAPAEPEPGEPEDEPAEAGPGEPGEEASDEGGFRDRVSGLLDRGGDEEAEPDEGEADLEDEVEADEPPEEPGDEGGFRDRVSGLLDRGDDGRDGEETPDSEAGEVEAGDPEDEAEQEERREEAGEEGGFRDRVSGLLDRGDDEEVGSGDEAADGDDEDGGSLRDRVSGLLDRVGGDDDQDDEAGGEAADDAPEAREDPGADAGDETGS